MKGEMEKNQPLRETSGNQGKGGINEWYIEGTYRLVKKYVYQNVAIEKFIPQTKTYFKFPE